MVVYVQERKATKKAFVYEKKKMCSLIDLGTYESRVTSETEKEVEKLKKSKEYQFYLRDKNNPRSFYNRER